MKQIAFLFLTIENPNFTKIWDSYFRNKSSKYNLYIHPKYPEKVTWKKSKIIKNLKETGWGFIVEAYYELLKAAFQNKNNLKFVTISESDVPIKDFDTFYNDCINDEKSWIKFLKIKKYNWEERIKKQPKNGKSPFFIKHYARFCLNRKHVEELLLKYEELKFFMKMQVGDEFFLSVLHPIKNVKNFDVTYDDWEYVHELGIKIKDEKRKIYEEQEKNGKNRSNKLKKLQNEFNQISKNPKTIINVEEDLDKIKECKSYFYRKFDKKSNIEKYWKNIINK
tara:strand:- start:1544 stop:2383 length:840 start_codon:yes stop_codon:yes gene_type:complete